MLIALFLSFQFDKETRVLCQSGFPKQIPNSHKNPCSFRDVITADKIKSIMTGEANLDTNHNIERVLRSVHEIDQKAEMVSNLIYTGYLKSLCPLHSCYGGALHSIVLFLTQLHWIDIYFKFEST